jgi:branched-chain amino acid transport system ATP-binding protein
MGDEPVAIIGRNGMGKTTLCNAIMQIRPATTRGSIRFRGEECVGRPSYKIAASGIGYVPQGRRLFESLTVDEHLRMVASRDERRWTPDAVYELFPRLAERRRNGGMQLSGGEQQMLAIGRALMLNPKMLLLDEPLEGLAPQIAQELLSIIGALVRDGRTAVILVEQHAHQILPITQDAIVLERGRAVHHGRSDELMENPTLLDRWLGVAAH